MIFNFLKKEYNHKKDEKLMLEIFRLLPKEEEFSFIFQQLNESILIGVRKINKKPYLNYTKFNMNTSLLNKYENKNGRFFQIKGITVFDLDTCKYIEVNIDIAFGLLMGYSTPQKETVNFDLTKIKIDGFFIKYFSNNDFESISGLLEKSEMKLINPSDVYEIT
jgi:hypothetical protein